MVDPGGQTPRVDSPVIALHVVMQKRNRNRLLVTAAVKLRLTSAREARVDKRDNVFAFDSSKVRAKVIRCLRSRSSGHGRESKEPFGEEPQRLATSAANANAEVAAKSHERQMEAIAWNGVGKLTRRPDLEFTVKVC